MRRVITFNDRFWKNGVESSENPLVNAITYNGSVSSYFRPTYATVELACCADHVLFAIDLIKIWMLFNEFKQKEPWSNSRV